MDITLVGFKDEFNGGVGSGIGRYSFELKNNLLNKKNKIKVIEISPIGKKRAITQYLGAYKFLFFNRDKTDIMHFISHNPAINSKLLKLEGRTKITIATAIEFGYLNTFDISKIGKKEFISNGFKLKDYLAWHLLQKNLKGTLGADFLIAISTQTKEEAIQLGFSKNNIKVINLGIDKRFLGRRLIASSNKFKVGCISSLRIRKNLEFAIKAINNMGNEVHFEIWGKGPNLDNLKKITKNKNIRFMGFAPENRIVDIYDSFDVYVHPTLYTGFELEILEAQARGLPVIIYKYGKIPNEVRKYCFEAESPEHMSQIIENLKENGYNEKVRKKATEYARSFTWERCAKETFKVYKNIYDNY
jgi:glycosyltransferase involved in cell wall biosynthesis